jgi:hypothetical protein
MQSLPQAVDTSAAQPAALLPDRKLVYMRLQRVIMSLSIRLSLSRKRIARQELCAEGGTAMPQTLEELRRALGFDKPSARVHSARAPRRQPDDDRDQEQPGELAAAARRAREALLTAPGRPSTNGARR